MFLKKYKDKLDGRYPSLEIALNWFKEHKGKVIFETGCLRLDDDWGAGMSTKLFGEFIRDEMPKAEFFSVDISPENIATAKRICQSLPINFIISDSIEALDLFAKSIDFLYLDSLDCAIEPEADNTIPQNHQLNEFKTAEDMLSKHAVVVLDDCGFANGGKCRLTKEYLRSRGWVNLWEDQQSVWVKRCFVTE